jgi:hypothetical protein
MASVWKKKKLHQQQQQIDINHIQKGISHGHKPAWQGEGEQREGKQKSN